MIAALVIWAHPLAAQTASNDGRGTELTASASAFGGYDTNVTGMAVDPRLQTSASQLGTILSLQYRVRSDKFTFASRANSDVRHYRIDEPVTAASFTGSAAFTREVTTRLRLRGSMQSSYFPHFQFSVLPSTGEVPFNAAPASLDYGLSTQSALNHQGNGGLDYRMSRRSSLYLNYGASTYSFLGSEYRMTTQTFGGGYSRTLTRYSTLRLGYGEQRGDYPAFIGVEQRSLRNRIIDVGVQYSRPLSLTRRTTFAFGTGTAAVERDDEVFYTVVGNAKLNHQLARTWRMGLAYSRGLGLVGGFSEPFFADSVAWDLEGFIRNRLLFTGSAGYSNGNVGLGSRANNYEAVQGDARLEIPLVLRRVALFGSYFYYRYNFDRLLGIPVGIAREVDRHGVRAGVTVRVPVLGERRARASR